MQLLVEVFDHVLVKWAHVQCARAATSFDDEMGNVTYMYYIAWYIYSSVEQPKQHATAIPFRKYPFSSDQGSQTGLGSTSTRLSDCPGTLSAVVFIN